MNETWPESVDLVVAGTGVAALSAAITAADAGLSVLMLESTDRWGGSSAMSGGGLWLPNNPLMRREGAADSRDEALTYLERTVGDAGPATSRERKEAFVDGVDGFVGLAERHGVRFARSADYPDYYPELPGGKIGRAIEVEPFDVRKVGVVAELAWPRRRARPGEDRRLLAAVGEVSVSLAAASAAVRFSCSTRRTSRSTCTTGTCGPTRTTRRTCCRTCSPQ